jgi:hypothetical protein
VDATQNPSAHTKDASPTPSRPTTPPLIQVACATNEMPGTNNEVRSFHSTSTLLTLMDHTGKCVPSGNPQQHHRRRCGRYPGPCCKHKGSNHDCFQARYSSTGQLCHERDARLDQQQSKLCSSSFHGTSISLTLVCRTGQFPCSVGS